MKGVKKTAAMYAGSANEAGIIDKLPEFMATANLKAQLIDCGFVVSKKNPRNGTSPDALVLLNTIGVEDEPELGFVEIKTRSAADTMHKYTQIGETFFGEVKMKKIDFEDPALNNVIPERNYRLQILHHASVTDVCFGLYVESFPGGKINYVVHVTFSDHIRSAWREVVLDPLCNIYIEPLLDRLASAKTAEEFAEIGRSGTDNGAVVKWGWAVDGLTAQQAIRIRNLLMDWVANNDRVSMHVSTFVSAHLMCTISVKEVLTHSHEFALISGQIILVYKYLEASQ